MVFFAEFFVATRNGSLQTIVIINNYRISTLNVLKFFCVRWKALNTLFQSMLPRPTESSDDAFLASMTLHLATVPVPIGGGYCDLKSSPYVATLPFRTWPCAAAGRNQAGISQFDSRN